MAIVVVGYSWVEKAKEEQEERRQCPSSLRDQMLDTGCRPRLRLTPLCFIVVVIRE